MWIFLGLFILIIGIWGTYLGYRLVKPLGLALFWSKVLWGMLYLPLLIPLILIMRRNLFTGPFSQIFEAIVLTSLAFYSFLLGLSLFRDTAAVLLLALSKILKKPDLSFFSTRQVLKSSCLTVIGASVLMICLGLYNALSTPEIIEVEVPVAGLHPDLDGFRIAQLTDLHADELKSKKYFEAITRAVIGMNPDITVITGDLADGSVETSAPRIESLINLPKETYFITGNHDYYAGYEEWIKHTASLGFKILLDDFTVIEKGSARILLAGVTDSAAREMFPDRPRGVEVAVQGAPAADFRILLAHQPKEIFDAEKFGFDLQISGHTHGGQFFPWNHLIGFFHPYVKGLNKHESMWIYVSQGTGFWGPPIRLGTRTEITLLILKKIE
jgi:uncharacterized protein